MDDFLDNGNSVRSTLDIALSAINKNYDRPGYQAVHKAFQDGGRDAVVLVGGSIALAYTGAAAVTSGAVEGVAYVARLTARSIGRQSVRLGKYVLKHTTINNRNWGSSAADLMTQLWEKNGDLTKVNLASIAGQFLVGGKVGTVVKSAVSNLVEISAENPFKFSHENKDLANFALGILSNSVSDVVGDSFGKIKGISTIQEEQVNFYVNEVINNIGVGIKKLWDE